MHLTQPPVLRFAPKQLEGRAVLVAKPHLCRARKQVPCPKPLAWLRGRCGGRRSRVSASGGGRTNRQVFRVQDAGWAKRELVLPCHLRPHRFRLGVHPSDLVHRLGMDAALRPRLARQMAARGQLQLIARGADGDGRPHAVVADDVGRHVLPQPRLGHAIRDGRFRHAAIVVAVEWSEQQQKRRKEAVVVDSTIPSRAMVPYARSNADAWRHVLLRLSASCIYRYSMTTPENAERPLPSTPEQLQRAKRVPSEKTYHVTTGSKASKMTTTRAPCTQPPDTSESPPMRAVKPIATLSSVA